LQVVYGIDGRQKLDEYCLDHLSGCENSRPVDASTVLMPMVKFISPLDPMWLAKRRTIEEQLVEDILVRRYEVEQTHVDGLPDGEGSFTACSFWFVECLDREGKFEKTQLLFEKLLGYANHLGLYSEQLGANGQHLGSFPQAFTHLPLISAATYLERTTSGKGERVWR
jgi:GH15 family glucan-1,4-alpha-glucosidase